MFTEDRLINNRSRRKWTYQSEKLIIIRKRKDETNVFTGDFTRRNETKIQRYVMEWREVKEHFGKSLKEE